MSALRCKMDELSVSICVRGHHIKFVFNSEICNAVSSKFATLALSTRTRV